MAGKKLTDELFLELLEKDRLFQEESKRIEEKRKRRTTERKELIQSYWVTPQNFYYRKKRHEEWLELRKKLKTKMSLDTEIVTVN